MQSCLTSPAAVPLLLLLVSGTLTSYPLSCVGSPAGVILFLFLFGYCVSLCFRVLVYLYVFVAFCLCFAVSSRFSASLIILICVFVSRATFFDILESLCLGIFFAS